MAKEKAAVASSNVEYAGRGAIRLIDENLHLLGGPTQIIVWALRTIIRLLIAIHNNQKKG